ncbi:MAG TPA: MarR family transcriptional regulator [Actinomycetota bacterium]|nr:MarR family transcriptional regulator [Actinomycetota bacterium]
MATRAPDTAELAARLRLAVTRLARRLRQEAEAGITPSMLSALSSAERQGPVTMRDLCAAEQVQPPTMTRIVAALVAAGLVVREADARDGRVAWVKVTPEGRRLLERSRRRKEAFLARALRDLDPRDVAALEAAADVLERFTEAHHEGERR